MARILGRLRAAIPLASRILRTSGALFLTLLVFAAARRESVTRADGVGALVALALFVTGGSDQRILRAGIGTILVTVSAALAGFLDVEQALFLALIPLAALLILRERVRIAALDRRLTQAISVESRRLGWTREGDAWTVGNGESARRISVLRGAVLLQGLPSWLTVEPRDPRYPQEGTGDGAFDAELSVRADLDGLAVLPGEARKRLRTLFALASGAISDGQVSLRVPSDRATPHGLSGVLRAMVTAADGIAPSPPVLEASLTASLEDPVAGVRRLSLARLSRHGFASAPAGAERLAGDLDPFVRLEAAQILGGERALAIVEPIALDESAPVEARCDAIRSARVLPKERVVTLLTRLLASRNPDVRLAVEQLAEARRDPELLAPLLSILVRCDAREAAVIARVAGAIGDSSAEPSLRSLLGRADPGARLAAIEALGTCGTTASVEPLMTLSKSRTIRNRLEGEVEAIEKTILRIQSRVGGAGGELALAAGGELSTTDEPGGRVSISEPQKAKA